MSRDERTSLRSISADTRMLERRALEILTDSIGNDSQATAAWSLLEKEAALMCGEEPSR